MNSDKILLDHGSGGLLSHKLIQKLFLPAFSDIVIGDGATLDLANNNIAFSTDTYVVDPIFFPGGSIGDLAVNGTVNDVSMCGANPKFLSVGFIIEEGFLITELKKITHDMSLAAKNAKVQIVTGDTKVVPKGAIDKIFINTTGIGIIPNNINISGKFAQPGNLIILSGTIADHGITIMTQRKGLNFDSKIKSDTAPLGAMVSKILNTGKTVNVLRDPTRGGLGTSLNEIAEESKVGIRIFEKNLPIKDEVASICNILGLDPLYAANEGKFIAIVPAQDADEVLATIKNEYNGKDACIIGEVLDEHPGHVFMKTRIGGERIVGMLTGDQLPRIC